MLCNSKYTYIIFQVFRARVDQIMIF
jgi:hypothetical protein